MTALLSASLVACSAAGADEGESATQAESYLPRGLHRTPAQIGELARAFELQRVTLTHNMERSLSRIDDSLSAIGDKYSGDVMVADNLDCFAL